MSIFKPTEDKFIRGIVSGIIAGTLKDIPAFILELMTKYPHPSFWEYMSLLSIGRIQKTWSEYLFAIFIQICWCSILATLFVYLQPKLQSKHYIMQGAGYGIAIWLLIRAIVYFSGAPELIHSNPITAFFNISISAFYGIMVSIINRQMDVQKEVLQGSESDP